MSRAALVIIVALNLVSSCLPSDAWAVDPLQIKIRKVGDVVGIVEGDFVELQMFMDGQTSLAGHTLSFWQPGPSGPVQQYSYTFPAGVVLDGTNQRRILIALSTVGGVARTSPMGLASPFSVRGLSVSIRQTA